jgi:Protein of unknown function (DUF2946)
MLAILMAALAPSVSQALGLSKGISWIEVCTAQGSKWLQGDLDGSGSAPASEHVLEHCPYCSLHVLALGMPPAPGLVAPVPRLRHDRPMAFLAAPRTLHAWVSAQPRAPPIFS